MIYDPEFRISYGIVESVFIQDAPRAAAIYQFIQNQMGKYFYKEIPIVLSIYGDHKLDCIEKNGRKGYAFEIINDHLMVEQHTLYVLRMKEAEVFSVMKDTIAHFNLSSIIHWTRNGFYTFNLWEK
jgi:hypothetical protein